MARSKNRRKKPKANKKSAPKKTKARSSVLPDNEYPDETGLESDVGPDEEYSGGMLVGMRNMISGGGQAEETMLSKRRSLTEWFLWFAVVGVIYYLVQYFLGN